MTHCEHEFHPAEGQCEILCHKCKAVRLWKPGPTVDISEHGEAPCLQSANRKARRAAKAHARRA